MSQPVVVVGAGIVGICSALSLRERGIDVVLVDRDQPASGASHGNAGVVSPWSCVPQSMPGILRELPRWLLDPAGPVSVRWRHAPRFAPWALRFLRAGARARLPAIGDALNALNRSSVDLYRRHLRGTRGEGLLVDAWYLHVFRDGGASLDGLAWRMRAERGVPLEVLGAGALHEAEPALSRAYRSAIAIKAQARALDPGAIGETLFEKACAMGARFTRARVLALKPAPAERWTVETDAGPLAAAKVVLAAGAWSARLLAPLGLSLPLEAERGYHLVLREPGVVVNHSIMDTRNRFVASSMRAGLRCAGTAEFAGLDAPPDYRRARIFSRLARQLFPDLRADAPQEWMGTRPSFPDSLPCIGEIPRHPGLFAAFGHSHYGFGMAPQTGLVVSALIAGEPPNLDLAPYRPDRFAG